MTESEIEAVANRVAEILLERLPDKQSTFWLTREEYIRQNKIGLRTLAKWIAEDRIETKRVGKRVLVANMAPWQASGTNTTEGGKDGGSAITGARRRSQSGLAI